VVKSEALSWAAEGIKMFGFGGLQPRPALECIKKGLADTNPAVRTAAVALLGKLMCELKEERGRESHGLALLAAAHTDILAGQV
jgi:hypothetical protein